MVPNALKFMRSEAPFFYEDCVAPSIPAAPVRTSVAATAAPSGPQKDPNMTLLSKLVEANPEKARAMMIAANWAPDRIASYLGEPAPRPAWAK
jgi:hypothetical protein